jgi:hypothetical protein
VIRVTDPTTKTLDSLLISGNEFTRTLFQSLHSSPLRGISIGVTLRLLAESSITVEGSILGLKHASPRTTGFREQIEPPRVCRRLQPEDTLLRSASGPYG